MLFKKEHKDMILSGEKIATRRVWKRPMVKVGGIYQAKLKLFSKGYFAKIKVTKLYKQRLGDMTQEDYIKEGYLWQYQFIDVWKELNGNYNPYEEVDVVEFEVVGV